MIKKWLVLGCLMLCAPAIAQESNNAVEMSLDEQKARLALRRLENQRANAQLEHFEASLRSAVAKRDGVWERSPQIPVCWESMDPSTAVERGWVRAAVRSSWEAESAVRFVGWGGCDAASTGIRIGVADEGPHVKHLGKLISGHANGMVLNFAFGNWSRSCSAQREYCIGAIAVHEFGHALSLAHEQNRTDAPLECQRERQGTDGDYPITIYDPVSIMNYCNVIWNNGGRLSQLDIDAVRILYNPLVPAPQP